MLGAANMYGAFSQRNGAVRNAITITAMDDWTELCYLQFAGGVSRTVFHGYSPSRAR
jgi:hypothetical protein